MVRFSEVVPRLPTLDLELSIDFYGTVLGFELSLLWPEKAPRFAILRRDEVELQFFVQAECQDENVDVESRDSGGDRLESRGIGEATLSFDVDDALELHSLIESVVAVEWGPDVYSYGRREFAFRDPNDYLIIISEPTEDDPTCIVE